MPRPSFLFKCKIRPGKTRISIGEKQISGGFPLRKARFKRVFRKCGEKLKTAEHNPIFGNKTAGRGSTKRGSGLLISVLPPHFRNRPSEVCGKFQNPRAHRHFCAKKPQVDALVQLGVVGLFRFCRILPESAPRGVHNPKDLLKSPLKILDICAGSVQYACLV